MKKKFDDLNLSRKTSILLLSHLLDDLVYKDFFTNFD